MRLHALVRGALPAADLTNTPDVDITGVQDDSRHVRAGDLFIARPGVKTDGTTFARDSVARGAVAVLTQTPIGDLSVPQVVVPDAAAAVSPLANAFFGEPSKAIKVIGITGTNGKTTTAYLVRHVLNALGHRCGMIGTVEIDDGRQTVEASMTTPSAIETARLLAAMRDNGCRACAIEVSSHALHQGRVSGVTFAGAGFTNLTGDHLDYHGTMDAYAEAKAMLFDGLGESAAAAINADSPAAARMKRGTRACVMSYGVDAAADYRVSDIHVTARGTRFNLASYHGPIEVRLKLIGRHNIENAVCAIVLCRECFGLELPAIVDVLADAAGAPGRLQVVPTDRPLSVLIDYAHTDDALRNVLSALRPLTTGCLRVVFGCGGDRDRTKRPRMASVAEELADCVYVTSDNPRTENSESIIREIFAGFETPAHVRCDVDRRKAIEHAINDAKPGDVILIAGKGHENYQIIGTTKYHFDDVEEATRALTAVTP